LFVFWWFFFFFFFFSVFIGWGFFCSSRKLPNINPTTTHYLVATIFDNPFPSSSSSSSSSSSYNERKLMDENKCKWKKNILGVLTFIGSCVGLAHQAK
jgi:hypothetical protein